MTKLANLSQKISELWTDTTDSAIKGINTVTTYSGDRLNDITEQAKTSLEGSLNQADNFSGYLVNSIQTRLNSLLQDWLANHPFIFWLCQHPIITVIGTFIIGVILWRLLTAIANAIASAIDKVWLWIFRAPILLLKSLFGVSEKVPVAEEKLQITIDPAQFQQIITQLHQIQAQQQLIIQEINTLKQTQEIAKSNLVIIDTTKESEPRS
ncbi:MAG: hypothetical protein QNJ41_06825 [Xenococcaceae cyanobacterium MO_188.B32]|nr:hypothetical protein [Xenococcaceae cyanobacterium MO_188.B32]